MKSPDDLRSRVERLPIATQHRLAIAAAEMIAIAEEASEAPYPTLAWHGIESARAYRDGRLPLHELQAASHYLAQIAGDTDSPALHAALLVTELGWPHDTQRDYDVGRSFVAEKTMKVLNLLPDDEFTVERLEARLRAYEMAHKDEVAPEPGLDWEIAV